MIYAFGFVNAFHMDPSPNNLFVIQVHPSNPMKIQLPLTAQFKVTERDEKMKNSEFALACIHGHVEDNNTCSCFEQARSFPSGLMPQFCVGLAMHLPCCSDLLNGLSDVTSHGKLITHAMFPHPLPI